MTLWIIGIGFMTTMLLTGCGGEAAETPAAALIDTTDSSATAALISTGQSTTDEAPVMLGQSLEITPELSNTLTLIRQDTSEKVTLNYQAGWASDDLAGLMATSQDLLETVMGNAGTGQINISFEQGQAFAFIGISHVFSNIAASLQQNTPVISSTLLPDRTAEQHLQASVPNLPGFALDTTERFESDGRDAVIGFGSYTGSGEPLGWLNITLEVQEDTTYVDLQLFAPLDEVAAYEPLIRAMADSLVFETDMP